MAMAPSSWPSCSGAQRRRGRPAAPRPASGPGGVERRRGVWVRPASLVMGVWVPRCAAVRRTSGHGGARRRAVARRASLDRSSAGVDRTGGHGTGRVASSSPLPLSSISIHGCHGSSSSSHPPLLPPPWGAPPLASRRAARPAERARAPPSRPRGHGAPSPDVARQRRRRDRAQRCEGGGSSHHGRGGRIRTGGGAPWPSDPFSSLHARPGGELAAAVADLSVTVRERTHICLSHCLLRKIGPAFASSVGGRFFDPKELCVMYFAYASRFASPVGDSLSLVSS